MTRDSLAEPVAETSDTLARFMRRPSMRLLWVEADPALFEAVVSLAIGFEHHALNRGPFIPLDVTHPRDVAATWEALKDELRARTGSLCAAGSPLEPLGPAPPPGSGFAGFCAQLLEVLQHVRAPAKGSTLVLRVDTAPQRPWLARLREIAQRPRLADARIIVVARAPCPELASIQDESESAAMYDAARVDPERLAAERRMELDAEARSGSARGAWPRGISPPSGRRRRSGGLPADAGRAGADVGASPDDEPRPGASLLLRRAALAMYEGDGPAAIRCQAQAREASLEAGDFPAAVRMEMILGAYLARLEKPDLAAGTLERATSRAVAAQRPDLAAEAKLAQGVVLEQANASQRSLRAYGQAIEHGRAADRPALVLEAYERAGLLALALGLESDAIKLLARAVAYARGCEPSAIRGTSAKAIADRLRELLSQRKRHADARLVQHTAARFE